MEVIPANKESLRDIQIVHLTPEEWQKYKSVRLRALKEEPTAFSSSYEDALTRPDEHWVESLAETDQKKLWHVFAKQGENIVGIVSAIREPKEKLNHVVSVFGVYVASEARGKGVARLLMEELLKEIKANTDIVKIKLTVMSTQDPAQRLYESLGFKKIGELKKELFINGEYIDEYLMEKIIR
ncbi:MAG TPA: GNAT family N-acetyltransferase [Candidatus Paceibacterota bacterium]|nr:GNAT family N-acetyltransferase [Candidatus Paceibacterota bacterium]